jgi:hypothetical protein
MDITITKTITTNGKFKLEVTGDYSGDKKTLDKIYNAVTDVVAGTADRISNANDVLAAQLWNSMQAHNEAKQEIKKLHETIEFDNMQIAHYDNELKQAIALLKFAISLKEDSVAEGLVFKSRVINFFNDIQRGTGDDENS